MVNQLGGKVLWTCSLTELSQELSHDPTGPRTHEQTDGLMIETLTNSLHYGTPEELLDVCVVQELPFC